MRGWRLDFGPEGTHNMTIEKLLMDYIAPVWFIFIMASSAIVIIVAFVAKVRSYLKKDSDAVKLARKKRDEIDG